MIDLTGDDIINITSKFGDALYVFNRDEFESNYKELENTFRKVYPNYHICYSYKTNYIPSICKAVKELGGYAEVVSDTEYELAIKCGYSPNMIVFNGPIKGEKLEQHLLMGGINNIDRIEEAEYICKIADNNKDKTIKTGIRINFDIDAGYISRFGIDVEHFDEVIELLRQHGVIINGLHCHMSRARGVEAWKNRANQMLGVMDKYQEKLNIEYISLGSGMYGHMDEELRKQFPGDIPNYTDYANAVLTRIRRFFENRGECPIIFTEPGTTLISKYVDFIGEVIGIKSVRNKQFVLLNCSFHNLGETCQMKQLPIRVYSKGDKSVKVNNADFVGYTCLEQDILYRAYNGNLSIGDYVLFGNVGGYSIVDKPPFILPNVPVIERKGTQCRLIKRRETFNDFFNSFEL